MVGPPLDLEIGSRQDYVPDIMRAGSIQSDGDQSDESYRSRWPDEIAGDEAIEPPRRPAYRTFLGNPPRLLSSSSVSSYAKKGTAWTCASCSYHNADSQNATCALCGFQLTDPSPADRLSPPQLLSDHSSIVPFSSKTSRVSPIPDGSIKLASASKNSTRVVPNSSQSPSESSIISLESLNTFLGRHNSSQATIRRTSSSSVNSESSASTAKASNTVQDHFWRNRPKPPRPESIVEGAEQTSSDGSARNLRNLQGDAQGTGGSLNSRGVRSPRACKPLRDPVRLELPPTMLCSESSLELSPTIASPASSIRSTYVPQYASSQDGALRGPSCFAAKVESGSHRQQEHRLTDIALLAPSFRNQSGQSSSFGREAPFSSTDHNRGMTLDGTCISVTYPGSPSSQTIAQDEVTTVSRAPIFATEPNLPKERTHRTTTNRVLIIVLFFVLLIAVAASVAVLVVTTKNNDAAPSAVAVISEIQPPVVLETMPPFENVVPTVPPTKIDLPTPSPIPLPPTKIPKLKTPSPTKHLIPVDDFVQLGQPVQGDTFGGQAGTFVVLADAGKIMAQSSKAGVVRVYILKEDLWIQLGQDLSSADAENVAANPIALSLRDGKVVAAILRTDILLVMEYNGIEKAWEERKISLNVATQRAGSSVSLSADGSTLAVATLDEGSGTGRVRVYSYHDAASADKGGMWRALGTELEGYSKQSGFHIGLSDDGKRLAVGTWKLMEDSKHDGLYWDRRVQVHEFSQKNSSNLLGLHIDLGTPFDRSIVAVAFGANGSVLAACTTDACSVYMLIYGLKERWEPVGDEVTGGEDVSLSANGTKMAVGIPTKKEHLGMVEVFEKPGGGSWKLLGCIVGKALGDGFGQSVSISGEALAIGVPRNNSAGGDTRGGVVTYLLE